MMTLFFVFLTPLVRVSLLDELNMQPTEPNSDDDKSEAHIPIRTQHPVLRRFPDEAARA